MRKALPVLMLILLVSFPCLASEPVAVTIDPMEEVKSDLTSIEKKMDQQNAASEQRLNVLEKKTTELSSKLGSSFGSTTIERRIADIERRIAKIEKDVDQLKSRVSKVEGKK